MRATPRLLAPVLLMLALAGCAGMATAPPRTPAAAQTATVVGISTEQGGRFIALAGPRRQHAEPFLGVPGTNFYTLRSLIDTRTGETAHQLYVSDSYAGAELDWNAARDAQGRPLRFIPISKNEITCQPSCSYAEEFAAALPEARLRESAGRLSMTFAARSGTEKTIAVPAELIRAQLAAVDRVRAGPPVAAAAEPPRPIEPRP